MNTLNDSLTAFDPDIAALIDGELRRQESGLEMGQLIAGPRFGLDQQVRRRLPGPALLRWL